MPGKQWSLKNYARGNSLNSRGVNSVTMSNDHRLSLSLAYEIYSSYFWFLQLFGLLASMLTMQPSRFYLTVISISICLLLEFISI